MSSLASVVLTGMGLVTPLGSELGSVVAAVRSKRTGIAPFLLDEAMVIPMGRVPEVEFPRGSGDMSLDFARHAAVEAWKSAEMPEGYDPRRISTVIGSSKGRVGNLLGSKSGIALSTFDPGNFTGDTLGLEIAKMFGFSGPVLNYPAACATGLVCMIRGVYSLQSDEADVVMAGSGEASGTALLMASFKNMGALSESPMRPFDRRRSGFNPGEGAAVFVMEREIDARRRGAAIIARVAGWDQRSDAYHITSANPDGETVAYSIRRAIERAGWEPSDVDYINAHGTGTRLNDMVEGRAINKALPGCRPLVSGLKPNIGHLLGASSAVELSMTLACARAGYIPATLGLRDPDPDIDLNHVPTGGLERRARRVLKLSLGFGGHIGVMALEVY